MAVYQLHDGGFNPLLWSQNGQNPQGLPKCDQVDAPASHYSLPYKAILKSINQTEVSGGCECKDCTPLAVGDVVTIGKIPGGSALMHVQWDVLQADKTLELDLEVRKTNSLTTAGTVIATSLGNEVRDGANFTPTYFSKYGVTCPGKDCYGNVTNTGGFDHAMLVLVVKALPTGGTGGCSLKCSVFGNAKMDFGYTVSDLK